MPAARIPSGPATGICGFMLWLGILTSPGFAHPHIFAEARLEIETSADGKIEELRNVWRFDELFSSTVVLEFDANKNLNLDPGERVRVGETVRQSLASFDYYTSITHDGEDIGVIPPDMIAVDYQDGQLLMIFAVRPASPIALEGTLSVGVYDPTMYAAIDFARDSDLVVTGESAGLCTRRIIRPDPDEVIAQNQDFLTEAFFNDPGGNNLSKLFATRIELECK